MPRINLDANEAKSMEAIPEGEYPAKIIEVGDVKKGPKARYLPVTFEVTDGERSGAKLFRNYPVEGEGAGFLLDLWNKLMGTDYKVGDTYDIDTDDLLNQECRVVVRHEDWQGEPQSRVAKVLKA